MLMRLVGAVALALLTTAAYRATALLVLAVV
jgi:hypothetical protein